jgi:hypothetical protein
VNSNVECEAGTSDHFFKIEIGKRSKGVDVFVLFSNLAVDGLPEIADFRIDLFTQGDNSSSSGRRLQEGSMVQAQL